MDLIYSDETIIACSTSPLGNAALAVIRISGFDSLSSLQKFFKKDLSKLQERFVSYTSLLIDGKEIDDICVTFFQAPRSYNGENILELSVHGNTLNVERIIEGFVSSGLMRRAYPGEFSYRALKNKKLTLSQVEGLDLFLNANSGFALDQGLSLLNGNLQEIYQEIWNLFLKHKSSLELSIDFSEDVGEEQAKIYFNDSLKELSAKIESLARRVQGNTTHLLSPEIVISGLPNAGKSSLFNLLLKEDRAIVSSVAGTTRDYISETITISGVNYRLVDTAGIRDSIDEIESEGIKRSHKKIKDAFFSLLLINPFETQDNLKDLLSLSYDLILFTHADLEGFEEQKKIIEKSFSLSGSIGAISLKSSGLSLQNLNDSINKKYLEAVSEQPLLLDRHKYLILHIFDLVNKYSLNTQGMEDVAIISSELNTLGHCISELVGIVSPDQVLNSIFSNFCIGK